MDKHIWEKLTKYVDRGLEISPDNPRLLAIKTELEKDVIFQHPAGPIVEKKLSDISSSPIVYSFADIMKLMKKGDIVISVIGRYKTLTQDDLVQYMRNEFIRRESGGDSIDHYHIITEDDLRNLVITCKNVSKKSISKIRDYLIIYFSKHNVTEDKIIISPIDETTYNIIVNSMVGDQQQIYTLVCEFREALEEKYEKLTGKIAPFKSKVDSQTDKKYWEWLISRAKLSTDLETHELTSISNPIYITQNFIVNGDNAIVAGRDITQIGKYNLKDIIKVWISENPPKKTCTPTNYYKNFVEDTGSDLTIKEFRDRMVKLGYVTKQCNKGRYYTLRE